MRFVKPYQSLQRLPGASGTYRLRMTKALIGFSQHNSRCFGIFELCQAFAVYTQAIPNSPMSRRPSLPYLCDSVPSQHLALGCTISYAKQLRECECRQTLMVITSFTEKLLFLQNSSQNRLRLFVASIMT